jgi:Circularly permutated YpsA SLOG family
MIFSLERVLTGGTKLTRDYAKKLGRPVLHIYDTRKERTPNPDSLRLKIQAMTDILRSNNIEVLNVAGPRESKELGVYKWTLNNVALHFYIGGSVSRSTGSSYV